MNKKLLWISVWTFLLGFLLMYLNFQLLYFLGIASMFVFTLWQIPKASGEYSDEEYAYEKRKRFGHLVSRLLTSLPAFSLFL